MNVLNLTQLLDQRSSCKVSCVIYIVPRFDALQYVETGAVYTVHKSVILSAAMTPMFADLETMSNELQHAKQPLINQYFLLNAHQIVGFIRNIDKSKIFVHE